MYELIIIGGGPAGITAGIYASRKNIKTLLITKDFVGQVGQTSVIANWPGEKEITGPDLMKKFEEHLKSYKNEIIEEKVISLEKNKEFTVKTENNTFKGKTVILTSGRKPRRLGVSGEKEFIGRGVVFCTTCDAPLFKGKTVVVVGGGNSGFESAIELTEYAKEVLLFERSSRFIADEQLQEKAIEKGVNLFKNTEIKKILGDLFVERIIYNKEGEEEEIKVDGVFVQIGSDPVTDFSGNLVEYDEKGDIIIDFKTCSTKTEGLFAAGDVTTVRDKQIIVAAGEGTKAALSVYNYLRK